MGKYKVTISEKARKHLQAIEKAGDKASLKKIEQIFFELEIHPESGTGKPEKLKFDLSGLWSRRINKKDRLVYSIENKIVTVTVVSILTHYGDK